MTQSNLFVTKLPEEKKEILLKALEEQGFEITHPPYTYFSAKKRGISCTLYTSLKLVVQGKEIAQFIEFFLEPEVLEKFEYSYKEQNHDKKGRIGVDEAGKGDFFGPLCVAAVFAEGTQIEKLAEWNVRDSKTVSDKMAHVLSKKIIDFVPHAVIRIGPRRYNELYEQFKNLNTLLAWGHATAIEQLSLKSSCRCVIVDKFAHESLVERALAKKNLSLEVEQKTKAESDIVVAAASIVARAAFLDSLETLSKKYGIALPKGASARCIEAGKTLVEHFGKEILFDVAKVHFRTTEQVLSKQC
jgi:ribonuclease HIII